jgi:condensin complex subunit 1
MEMRLQLLEILESRILDKSTWTRCRVLHAWAQVSHGHGIPRDRWIGCFKLIIERMSDTSSNVRRTAMATLAGMIDEHPYGDLDIPKNETWLNSVNFKITEFKEQIGDREPTDEEKAKLDKHTAARMALENRLDFARVVHGSQEHLARLLLSSVKSDALEAIDTVVAMREAKLVPGEWPPLVAELFALVWSQEADIKHCVVKAFSQLYIVDKPVEEVVDGFVQLLKGPLTHGDLASIVEILGIVITEKDKDKKINLPAKIVPHLLKREEPEALIVVAAIAQGKAEEVEPYINPKKAEAAETGKKRDKGEKEEKPSVLKKAQTGTIASIVHCASIAEACKNEKLLNECLKRVCAPHEPTGDWFLATQKTMDASFAVAQDKLDNLDEGVRGHNCPLAKWSEILIGFKGNQSTRDQVRLLFVGGHLALKSLIWCEACRNLLKRQRVKHEKPAETDGVGIAKDEEDNEHFAQLEERLVNDHLLGALKPIIVKYAKEASVRRDSPVLASAAPLALCKFMVVSTEFCKEQIPTLITILFNDRALNDLPADRYESVSKEIEHLRSCIIIAMGDLLWRHPNVIEPCTKKLFSTLSDPQESARFAGATVFTNLTLGDMVKAKGELCWSMLLCTKDKSGRVARLARIFFRELHKKPGSIVYNCIPDLLSRLVRDEASKEYANEHLKFLMHMVDKDKHEEQLVDKLCARMTQAEEFGREKALGTVALLSHAMAMLSWKHEKVFHKLEEVWSRDLEGLIEYSEELRMNLHSILDRVK